jgi:hypothetical protein
MTLIEAYAAGQSLDDLAAQVLSRQVPIEDLRWTPTTPGSRSRAEQ